jgi:uncharacterized membrane protein YqjE
VTDQEPTYTPPPIDTPGLIAGLSGVVRNLFGLLLSRVELAALEMSAVRTQLLKLLLVAALGIFMALFAILYWTGLVVYLSWDTLGWKILLIMALGFTVATAAIVVYIKSLLGDGKLSLPATLAELARDRDALL